MTKKASTPTKGHVIYLNTNLWATEHVNDMGADKS